jgi:hypothetical protein
MAVTPVATLADEVAVGGTSVVVIGANPQGGIIQNPIDSTDQGISAVEPLYVDPTGAQATTQGNGTTFRLEPGQTWNAIAGQTTSTSMNAATSGHRIAGVSW